METSIITETPPDNSSLRTEEILHGKHAFNYSADIVLANVELIILGA